MGGESGRSDSGSGGFLRDPGEAALNRVQVLCQSTASQLRSASERAEDGAIARELAGLAARREAHAATLKRRVEGLGELPEATDPDRELVKDALQWLRAAVAGDTDAALLDALEGDHSELLSALDEAGEAPVGEDAKRYLDGLRREVAFDLERLRARGGEGGAAS